MISNINRTPDQSFRTVRVYGDEIHANLGRLSAHTYNEVKTLQDQMTGVEAQLKTLNERVAQILDRRM